MYVSSHDGHICGDINTHMYVCMSACICHKVNDIRLIFSLVMFSGKTHHCSILMLSFDGVITNVKHSLESYIRGSTEFFDTQHS